MSAGGTELSLTMSSLLGSSPPAQTTWNSEPSLTDSALGHGASALPAAHVSCCDLPSDDRISTVAAESVSGRHRCSLEASTTHTLPLWLTSMSQMLGLCATS